MNIEQLFNLAGRTALVSGASSGIGLHIAQTLASAGASVVLAARRTDRLDAAVATLKAEGRRAAAVYLDVTQPQTIAAAFDKAEQELGGVVDILFNNAGVIHAEKFVDQKEADIDRVFDTNVKGVFMVAQEAARRMISAQRGAIINVASTAGLRAGGYLSSYAASKASVIHLSQVMALELASANIRVNALCPGNIETEMQATLTENGFEATMIRRTPMRRFGRSEDLDGAVLLLASDAGRYMTGSSITVDGGQTLSWM
jgi:NAD(P)-dependent dehydrogenase (short-subunit alcohol dehydrogenase family)